MSCVMRKSSACAKCLGADQSEPADLCSLISTFVLRRFFFISWFTDPSTQIFAF